MKRLFYLLTVLGLLFVSCEEGNIQDPSNDNHIEQPGEEEIFELTDDGIYVVKAEGGTVQVVVVTNVEYTVDIPKSATKWLSVSDTRGTRVDKLVFTIARNKSDKERSATVCLLDVDGDKLESIKFLQDGAAVDDDNNNNDDDVGGNNNGENNDGNDNDEDDGSDDGYDEYFVDSVVGEWVLVLWCDATPEFKVYIEFKSDNTFEMYQQVYTLNYELYTGVYSLTGRTLSGSYDNGIPWQCDYTVTAGNKVDDTINLILKSKKDGDNVSIYTQTTIPDDVKAEAVTTRAEEFKPFL